MQQLMRTKTGSAVYPLHSEWKPSSSAYKESWLRNSAPGPSRGFDKGFTGCNGRENRQSPEWASILAKKYAGGWEADIQVKSQLGMFTEVVLTFRRKIAEE